MLDTWKCQHSIEKFLIVPHKIKLCHQTPGVSHYEVPRASSLNKTNKSILLSKFCLEDIFCKTSYTTRKSRSWRIFIIWEPNQIKFTIWRFQGSEISEGAMMDAAVESSGIISTTWIFYVIWKNGHQAFLQPLSTVMRNRGWEWSLHHRAQPCDAINTLPSRHVSIED